MRTDEQDTAAAAGSHTLFGRKVHAGADDHKVLAYCDMASISRLESGPLLNPRKIRAVISSPVVCSGLKGTKEISCGSGAAVKIGTEIPSLPLKFKRCFAGKKGLRGWMVPLY